MGKTLSFLTLAIVLMFTVSAIAHDKVVVVPLAGKKATGDAVAEDVLEGKTFSNKDEVGVTGTMLDSTQNITPGNTTKTIPAGYHDGSGSVATDANLTSGNIKSGVSIFGVTGNVNVPTGDAVAADVKSGKTFSNASGINRSGSMTVYGASETYMPSTTDQNPSAGYHNGSSIIRGDADLKAANIVDGITIFNVTGTASAGGGGTTCDVFDDLTNWGPSYVRCSGTPGTCTYDKDICEFFKYGFASGYDGLQAKCDGGDNNACWAKGYCYGQAEMCEAL